MESEQVNEKICPVCKEGIKEAAKVCKHCKSKLIKCDSCDEWTGITTDKCMICESELSVPKTKTKKDKAGPRFIPYLLYALPLAILNGIVHGGLLNPTFYYSRFGVDYTSVQWTDDIFATRLSNAVILYPLLFLVWGVISRKISTNEKPFTILKRHLIGLIPIILLSYAIWGQVQVEVMNYISFTLVAPLLFAFPNKLRITLILAVIATILSNSLWFLFGTLQCLDNLYLYFRLFLLDWVTFFLLLPPILFYQQIVKNFSSEELPILETIQKFYKNELSINYKQPAKVETEG